jgi:nucleolar MIF4G domain-containing protein 1
LDTLTLLELLVFADLVGPGGNGLSADVAENQSESDMDMPSSDEEEDELGLSGNEDELGLSGNEDHSELAASDNEGDSGGLIEKGMMALPREDTEASMKTAVRYIPPHERAALLEAKSRGDKAKEMERAKLERRAQGVLNK